MTAQMTPAQARQYDPVLTNIALGYSQPDLVGNALFPEVDVAQRGGKVITFGKESFQAYNTTRTPGTPTKRFQFGYNGASFALENHSLEAMVPEELMQDASQVPGIDLAIPAVNDTMAILKLELEAAQAGIATNAANYDANHQIALSGTSKFSNDASNPIKQIDQYKEAIRATTGRWPNVIVFSAIAWQAFRDNPYVLGRIQYVQQGVITEQLAAALLGIAVVKVGAAVSANNANVFSDVWGNNVVLAVAARASLNSPAVPSYGYTYRLKGNPLVEVPYQDRNLKSWLYPVTYERVPVLSGITSGFLIQNPA